MAQRFSGSEAQRLGGSVAPQRRLCGTAALGLFGYVVRLSLELSNFYTYKNVYTYKTYMYKYIIRMIFFIRLSILLKKHCKAARE